MKESPQELPMRHPSKLYLLVGATPVDSLSWPVARGTDRELADSLSPSGLCWPGWSTGEMEVTPGRRRISCRKSLRAMSYTIQRANAVQHALALIRTDPQTNLTTLPPAVRAPMLALL